MRSAPCAILCAIVVGIVSSYHDEAVAQSVSRTRRGDTTVVASGAGGEWKTPRTATRLFRLGADGPVTFGHIACMAALPDGGVAVLDTKGASGPTIVVLDADGKLVRNLGRSGSGPGEFRTMNLAPCMAADAHGVLYMLDFANNRINRWSANGTTMASVPLSVPPNGPPPYFVVEDDGSIFVRIQLSRPKPSAGWDRRVYGYVHLAATGQVLDTLPAKPEWTGEPPARTMDPEGLWNPLPDGRLFIARTDRLGFVAMPASGGRNPLAAVAQHTALAVSDAEVAEQAAVFSWSAKQAKADIKNPGMASVKPHFWATGILTDFGGRLWLPLHTTAIKGRPLPLGVPVSGQAQTTIDHFVEPPAFAIFKPDGTYIGDVRLPLADDETIANRQFVTSKGRVWGMVQGPDDEPLLVKWRIEGLR